MVTKKVISKPEKVKEEMQKQEEIPKQSRIRCLFCKNNTKPTFTDVATLRKFISERARILPKAKSGLCSKHQRRLARQIKYARHLAMLPFTPFI